MNKYITLQMYIKQKEKDDTFCKQKETKYDTKTSNQVNKKETNEFLKIDDETLLILFSI
jgi:hypothetical protein